MCLEQVPWLALSWLCVVVTAKRTGIVHARRTGPAGMRVGAKGGWNV
jgi:hypothetical protein